MLQTKKFIRCAQSSIPKFNIKFKNKSPFMKFLGALLFFDKRFDKQCVTAIRYTIYIPTEKEYIEQQEKYLQILAYEFCHMLEYKKYNALFIFSYLFPYILIFLVLPSLIFLPYHFYALLVCFPLFIVPMYFRILLEIKGHTVKAAFNYWRYGAPLVASDYVDELIGSNYYMWPMKKSIAKQFQFEFDKLKRHPMELDYPLLFLYIFMND